MALVDFRDEKQVVALLQRSLENGRLAHAYLFKGGALGRLEAMARALAKAVNCQEPARRGKSGLPLDSCDQCASCQKIENESHPDLQWVRPESKSRVITIGQVRNLLQTIYLKPNEARFKVAIMVAAERLNIQAANAFLKTLEEPPASSIILLLSTDPERLLETIVSRCLRLSFSSEGRMDLDDARQAWLTTFCVEAAREQKGLLARYRLLSVVLNKLAEIKADTEKTLTQRSPLERFQDIEPALRERWEDELSAAVEAEYRRQRTDLLLAVQWWFRDVWLKASALSDILLTFPGLGQPTQAVACRISAQEAVENLGILEQTQRLLGSNVQEALALEVGMLKLKL